MIRHMNDSDIEPLVRMGSIMHAESSFRQDPYSPAKCRDLGGAIVANDNLLGLVAEKDGEIVGFFLGVLQEQYFSECLMSADLLLYVKPEHRNGMTGVRLVKGYIQWAESKGVERRNIGLGQTAEIDIKAVDRLYQKLGFRNAGTIYKLRG